MLRLLIGRDWTANRDEIIGRIARDVANRRENRVLMVPELVSHEMERRLCQAAGDTASRYAEVLSFTRLARRVADSMGSGAIACLDEGGRVVAMAAAARQLSSRLKAYAAVETKPDFLSGVIDCIDEFKRCCISAGDLAVAAAQTEGSLAQKLEELSLLMESYDSLCSRGKRDPRDQMTWLLEQLEQGTYAREHTFYIDGFPDFTRQNLMILEHLIENSPEVTVSLNCDQPDSALLAFEKAGQTARELLQFARRKEIPVEVETVQPHPTPLAPVRSRLFQGSISPGEARECLTVCRAESAYQACMHCAEQVMELVSRGCRYRDITLVCTDLTTYQPVADLVFHRFHIPVYRSGREDILQKNVISTVLTGIEAVLGGFEQRSVLRYLRSALSPLDPDTCDQVENYAIIWGIRGNQWANDWTNHPEGLSGDWNDDARKQLADLNAARELAIWPLKRMQQGFREGRTLADQIGAVYGFLQDLNLEQRLSDMALEMDQAGENRETQILNQLWEILLSALEQMYDVLGQTQWEPEHFSRLLRLLLSQYTVGTIPPVLDAVQMGQVSAMRCHQEKYLLVLGAEEGKLPGYSGSTGVLTDQERVTLRNLGVPLTGGAMEGIQSEFGEIYGVFCGAVEHIWVYSASDQPSFVYRRLLELAGAEQTVSESLGFACADAREAGAYLARWGEKETARSLGVENFYQEAVEKRDYTLGTVAAEQIRGLYGNTLNLSASQIDRQAECRLSYFLRYGMRAKERKEITVDPAEFGSFVHAVLENTARCIRDMGGFHQVSLEQTQELAHRFSEEYAAQRFSQLDSQRMTYLFQRNLGELDMVIQELWQELSQALFEPVEFELAFGGEGKLPPIAIPNGKINALLRGFVDRVDVWDTGACRYFRVVDYKTGKKDFDYCDVFNGVGLQMLLYLFALRDSGGEVLGDKPVAAGVQYFPARAPYLPVEGRVDAQSAQAQRKPTWRRKGLLLEDESVLQAMEPGEDPQRMSYSIRKDGTLVGDLANREQLKLLREYVFQVLAGLVEDIASGNVEPNPYTRGTSHSACDFCPYGTVCHKEQVEGRRNYKTMTAQRFWEEIEKERNRHGR